MVRHPVCESDCKLPTFRRHIRSTEDEQSQRSATSWPTHSTLALLSRLREIDQSRRPRLDGTRSVVAARSWRLPCGTGLGLLPRSCKSALG